MSRRATARAATRSYRSPSDDLAYLDEMLRGTNAMLAAQAAANDAEYVDTYADSVGHDVCTLPGRRWFEGVVPTAPAYPVHPNALGEASMARSVLRVLAGPRPGPVLGTLRRARAPIRVGSVGADQLHAESCRDRDGDAAALARRRPLYARPPRAHPERRCGDDHRDADGQGARPAGGAVPHRAPRCRAAHTGDARAHPTSPRSYAAARGNTSPCSSQRRSMLSMSNSRP